MLLAFLIAAAAPSLDAAALQALAQTDARLVAIGRRLAQGGAGLCSGVISNPGWTVEDAEQFEPRFRPSVKATLHLGDYPTVTVVEPDSPAARAGIAVGDELMAVGDLPVAPAPSSRAGRVRQDALERATAAGLSRGMLKVEARRASRTLSFDIAPEPGCASDFLIGRDRGLRAAASDGVKVTVSTEIIDFARNDDELALILAHEFAHNILGHNKGYPAQRVAGEDRSGTQTRDREREADRWALYLMARAGYDVGAAPGFWRRWGPKTGFGILSDGSHPDWRDRVARAEAEIPRIKAKQAASPAPVP